MKTYHHPLTRQIKKRPKSSRNPLRPLIAAVTTVAATRGCRIDMININASGTLNEINPLEKRIYNVALVNSTPNMIRHNVSNGWRAIQPAGAAVVSVRGVKISVVISIHPFHE